MSTQVQPSKQPTHTTISHFNRFRLDLITTVSLNQVTNPFKSTLNSVLKLNQSGLNRFTHPIQSHPLSPHPNSKPSIPNHLNHPHLFTLSLSLLSSLHLCTHPCGSPIDLHLRQLIHHRSNQLTVSSFVYCSTSSTVQPTTLHYLHHSHLISPDQPLRSILIQTEPHIPVSSPHLHQNPIPSSHQTYISFIIPLIYISLHGSIAYLQRHRWTIPRATRYHHTLHLSSLSI